MTLDDLRKAIHAIREAGFESPLLEWAAAEIERLDDEAEDLERALGDSRDELDAASNRRCELQERLSLSEETCRELAARADRAETDADSARRRIAELEGKINRLATGDAKAVHFLGS